MYSRNGVYNLSFKRKERINLKEDQRKETPKDTMAGIILATSPPHIFQAGSRHHRRHSDRNCHHLILIQPPPQFPRIYWTFCAEQICYKDNNRSAIAIREGIRKKYGIIWEFFPNSGPPPPPPPFGNFDHFLPYFFW